jgi:microcompartment protein CcmK/EutM
MFCGEVLGRVWNERQIPGLENRRLVSVASDNTTLVAVDLVEVAAGNTVLVATDEAAQTAVSGDKGGVDAVVVGLVAGADHPESVIERRNV